MKKEPIKLGVRVSVICSKYNAKRFDPYHMIFFSDLIKVKVGK